MKEEQQRIAIAEACGWDCDPPESHNWKSRGQWCKAPESYRHIYPHKNGSLLSKNMFLPDYLNDLNAMHEAEKTLDDRQHRWFRGCLQGPHLDDRNKTSANAAQRAEAFLKTIGKLEDEP